MDRKAAVALVLAFAACDASAAAPQEAWSWDVESRPALTVGQVRSYDGSTVVAIGDPCVLPIGDRYLMWFGYGTVSDEGEVRVSVGMAESDDAIEWRFACTSLAGSGSGFDRTNAEIPCVVVDESAPEGDPRRFRLYYGGIDEELNRADFGTIVERGMLYGIGLAFSSDGRAFTRLPPGESPHGEAGLVLRPNPVVMEHDMEDFLHVADPHVVRANGRWHMWYTSICRNAVTNEVWTGIGHAISDDGIRWEKQGVALRPEASWERRGEERGVGRPCVSWTGSRFEMFYDAGGGAGDPEESFVGFAHSEDGQSWTRVPQPVRALAGARIGSGAILLDDRWWLYTPVGDGDGLQGEFRLARRR